MSKDYNTQMGNGMNSFNQLQTQLWLKPKKSMLDEYLNIIKSSLQQASHSMVLNVLFYSLANSFNAINEALMHLFYFDACWYPSIALGLSYFCIQLGLLMYERLLHPESNQNFNQSVTQLLFNTSKIIFAGMSFIVMRYLFDTISLLSGLSFWQYSLLMSSVVFIGSFLYNSTSYFYNSMKEVEQQYEPMDMKK
jgi:hypothetical protein